MSSIASLDGWSRRLHTPSTRCATHHGAGQCHWRLASTAAALAEKMTAVRKVGQGHWRTSPAGAQVLPPRQSRAQRCTVTPKGPGSRPTGVPSGKEGRPWAFRADRKATNGSQNKRAACRVQRTGRRPRTRRRPACNQRKIAQNAGKLDEQLKDYE